MINQIDTVLYTGKTVTTGGRQGESHSDDGRLDIKLSPPGSSGSGTNPNNCWVPVGRPASLAPWARQPLP